MKTYGGVEVWHHAVLTSILDGRFTPEKKTPIYSAQGAA